ncbi:MAG: hypothetical protein U9Q81_14650 [Pseudomonadota bacterium]|nr:hypothetical protein [Pseudomonadota bacterium]
MGELLKATELVQRLTEEGRGSWSAATVYKWLLWSPPCPIRRIGKAGVPHLFDLDEVLTWLDEHQERVSRWNGLDTGEAFKDPRMEKARQEARVAKLKADQIEGLSVPLEAVRQSWMASVVGARTVILQMPERMAQAMGIPLEEQARFVEKMCNELDQVMRRLADSDAVLAGLTGPDGE